MKKGLMIIAAVGLLVAVSCKKDRTCSCTITSSGTIFGDFTLTADTVYTDMSKGDAETLCNSEDASYTDGTESTTIECELK